DEHAVETRSNAAEDHFAKHDVGEGNHSAERGKTVVHAVHCATTCVRRDGGKQRGLSDAVADFLAFHVAAGSGRGDGLLCTVDQWMGVSLGPVECAKSG